LFKHIINPESNYLRGHRYRDWLLLLLCCWVSW